MTTFRRTLIVLAAIVFAALFGTTETHAAFTTPARSGASSGPPVDVADALKIAAHDEVLDLSLRKMEALAAMLARATDERSAREILPAAERCYLELQLVALRGQMLPPPSAAERPKLADRASRFIAARAALDVEIARIAAAPPLAFALRPVMFPLHGQMQDMRAQQGNSLTSQLQTLRSQIELYKLQHRDQAPDFRRRGWNPLTARTAEDGAESPRGKFGPYLQSPPRNPLNGNTRLLIVRGTPGTDFRYDKNDAGFVYDELSGRLWALDADGRVFNEAGGAQAQTH
jgi:hypothetical protein